MSRDPEGITIEEEERDGFTSEDELVDTSGAAALGEPSAEEDDDEERGQPSNTKHKGDTGDRYLLQPEVPLTFKDQVRDNPAAYQQQRTDKDDLQEEVPLTFKDQVRHNPAAYQQQQQQQTAVVSVEGTPVNDTSVIHSDTPTLPVRVLETYGTDGERVDDRLRINAKNTVGSFQPRRRPPLQPPGDNDNPEGAGGDDDVDGPESVLAEPLQESGTRKHLIWATALVLLAVVLVVGIVVSVVLVLREDGGGGGETPTPTTAPTTVPPTAAPVNNGKLTASDGASLDFFGFAVGVSGDTIAVGAYRDSDNGSESGSAYIYQRQPTTSDDGGSIWAETAKLTASDGATGDLLGISVAVDGDTVVLGSIRDDDNAPNTGSVYVFVETSSASDTPVWTQQAKLTASDWFANNQLGSSVSISGDTIVAGSSGDDSIGQNAGSAYVFVRDGDTSWTEQAKLTASDGSNFDIFGDAVAIDGDTVVVGAWGNQVDNDNSVGSGSAYIFVRNTTDGAPSWSEQAKLTAPAGADEFGRSVAVSQDTVIVGAGGNGEDFMGSGSVHVYMRSDQSNTTWTEQATLKASDGNSDDRFGSSVSISGNALVVGSYHSDDNGVDSGSVYVFVRLSSTTWTEQAKLTAFDAASNDNYGVSVAIDQQTIVVGANQDGDNGDSSGSAYVIDLRRHPFAAHITRLYPSAISKTNSVRKTRDASSS